MDRRICTITVRGEERRYDPLRLRRSLLRETGGELWTVWEKALGLRRALAAREPVPAESIEAEEVLLEAGRIAFGMEPDAVSESEGAGYTDEEVWQALGQWSRWVGKVAAAAESGPTSPRPTDSGPGDGSPTPTSAPCT